MSPKTSPNDRCPCGSGKKYKRCCMESDRAAAPVAESAPADAAHSPHPTLVGLKSAWRRGDMRALADSLELLPPLLEAGGPLGSIRFDETRFEKALVGAIDGAADLDDEARRDWVLKACVRGACDPHEAESLIRRMTAVASDGHLPPETEGTLSFWLATTEAALETGGEALHGAPLLLAIAAVQADELSEARQGAAAKLSSLIAGLEDRSMSLSDVSRELEEHGDELAGLFATVPGLAKLAESSEAKMRGMLPRLLRGRGGLRVLGMDEFLLLALELSRLKADQGDGEASFGAIADHLRQHPLVGVVLARLRLASRDPGLSSGKRDRFNKAAVLLELDPAAFFLTALKENSIEESVGENACLESAGSQADAIEALAAHYESLGLAERAARARRAAEIARSLPPPPPTG
ncbi:MAG TPA: SEC-C domain-containing protein [Myxococcales bacterium]|jgi:hypothetical protein